MTQQYSLSEVDALARRATRGAGYSWGLAEDAGKSVRWLTAYGFSGCEALAGLLQKVEHHVEAFKPRYMNTGWISDSGFLCPIHGGALINDKGHLLTQGEHQTLSHLLYPILALPQAARLAEIHKTNVLLTIENAQITCTQSGLALPSKMPELINEANVHCQATDNNTTSELRTPSPMGRPVSDEAIEFLKKMAHKTYAPATDSSRLAGAGAGLTDND